MIVNKKTPTFVDKYISTTANALTPDAKKLEISDEAFALGLVLEELKEVMIHNGR